MPATPKPKCSPVTLPPLTFTLNGRAVTVAPCDPDMPLLYLLRDDLGLTGAKYGCGKGQCGACTVLVDGEPARSCVLPSRTVAGRTITTIEGLGNETAPHPVQAAFIAEQAAQCGYCTSGMVMETAALLDRNPQPSLNDAKLALDGHLCRCGSHRRILRAVMRAAGTAEP